MSKPLTMNEGSLDTIRLLLSREPEHVQKNAKALLAEVDALRAALAAAEAKLADERKHADALAGLFEPIASGRLVPWLPCKHAENAMAMHAARRAAEAQ